MKEYKGEMFPILVEQGGQNEFLNLLKPENLVKVADEKK